jgi:hypothetical protein
MSTTTTNRLSLVQRRGDAELPANGRWTLHRASFVGISTRRHRRQLSVADGSLTIVGPPDQSTLVITAALAQQWMRLTASTVAVDADGFGFSRWQLNGTVDDGTTRHPSELDIRYHGVHGRGDQARAWFTGRAATPSGTYRFRYRRFQLDIVLDLLFDPPTNTAAPSPPHKAAHEQPTEIASGDPSRSGHPAAEEQRRQPATAAPAQPRS